METNGEFLAAFGGGCVRVFTGDITRCATDAIVNAANSTLLGGGGVDGAIHRAGGAKILEECRELRRTKYPNGLPTGEAIITTGGNLPARFVIHTVGPIWRRHVGREADLLASCYRNSLAVACETGLASITFPAISTGVYGYPKDEAARVASRAIEDFLNGDEKMKDVRLIFFSSSDARMFLRHEDFKK